ncbi:hypothetical protein, partial [uncultured Alistipes sp.]|uniref:hypothetical protein n=1 Tax=uncultured Alistipes sp. TaxID=538949 RepID=UPI002649DC32
MSVLVMFCPFVGGTDKGAGQHPFEGTPRPTQGADTAPYFRIHYGTSYGADFGRLSKNTTHILSGSVSDIQATCMG